ncbi:MAG: hypothetical protein ABJF11_00690 [Reichenbachiella sp.]|uniref:hypothetical protein n=1 Tax=Reichenbachiella sp. TaxID=2184521 RepID=UPI00326463FB
MKFTLTTFVFAFILTLSSKAQDHQYITTNKVNYVVGHQVLFDVFRFDQTGVSKEEEEEVLIAMDLVAPTGDIVQTKSFIKSEEGCYFFSLSDSLETGIYRLVANSAGAFQAIKRVHVFGLELEEQLPRSAKQIDHIIEGGTLGLNMSAKVAVRVTDSNGAGLLTKGTLVNSVDSLVTYIDTDANGLASFDFTPSDSLYKVRFGTQTLELAISNQPITTQLERKDGQMNFKIGNTTGSPAVISIAIDGNKSVEFAMEAQMDSTIQIATSALTYGLHKVDLTLGAALRSYYTFVKPNDTPDINLQKMELAANEQSEFAIEDAEDAIDRVSVTIIDDLDYVELNFYEEYYLDQLDLDLQVVGNRDLDAYVLFYANTEEKVNQERMDAVKTGGVLSYKFEYPFDEVSMLNLSTMKAVDMRSENIRGIHDFEKSVGEKSQIYPYHFTTYLQPIKPADFREKVLYSYPALKSIITIGEREVNLIKAYDLQKNILLSYQTNEKEDQKLPAPDYVYNLTDYDVPNTMIDMINYVVKFVSVLKNNDGTAELSMYRYMSTYKYRGNPLIFLNDLPIYDARTILNLNPKDFERVEVRNSYQSNGHLGNFSLNGSVSFFLKEGVDNPLEDAYSDLPIIESCTNFNKKSTGSEYAPDFRHQLYWNSDLRKTKDSFWVDMKSSDLNTTYKIQVTAFMKDGTVVQEKSTLAVK